MEREKGREIGKMKERTEAMAESGQAEALSRAQGSGCWRFLLLMSFLNIFLWF